MERDTKDVSPSQLKLFELPAVEAKTHTFKQFRHPIWTEHKAKLIARYLYYFVLVTRHGAYIDGFAGPQEPAAPDTWSARLVLESEPRWLRTFFLCDKSDAQFKALEALKASQPEQRGRSITLYHDDFNKAVYEILKSPGLGQRVATFCLLDQRTLECHWKTVEAVAHHKSSNKVEQFYFVPTGWLHRSLSGLKDGSTAEIWWGKSDWDRLRKMTIHECAAAFCDRFKKDLGYAYAHPWPIYERQGTTRVMYHMVHASDHPEAPNLMARAYRRATGAPEPLEQLRLEFDKWRATRTE
jgi:three-Cys-motif partner protein